MVFDLDSISDESAIMPALVRLYDSQRVMGLAQNSEAASRNELTSIIVSLLEMDLSIKESELVADVLISLMRQIERDLCFAIAERLSVMETVPLRLALHLANEEIRIAQPILKNSKVFSDMDLIYIIKSKPAEYWRAIAQREELSAQVVNTLAETKDFETALKLVENQNIELTDQALNIMVDLAQESDLIAGPLLRRNETTEEVVKVLYQCVGTALKHYIREEFEMFEEDVSEACNDIVFEFVEAASSITSGEDGKINEIPAKEHIKVAQRYKERNMLTIQLMLKTLKRGQYQSFVAQFSLYLGLSHDTIQQILRQKSGQGLAVACRAMEIERSNFVSIYLLGTRLRNRGGMLDVRELKRATDYYDKIDRETALKILKNSQETEGGYLQ